MERERERHVGLGMFYFKTVTKHPKKPKHVCGERGWGECRRKGWSWNVQVKESKILSSLGQPSCLDLVLAPLKAEKALWLWQLWRLGSWHISATPRSLGRLWWLAVLGLEPYRASGHLASLTEFSQLRTYQMQACVVKVLVWRNLISKLSLLVRTRVCVPCICACLSIFTITNS